MKEIRYINGVPHITYSGTVEERKAELISAYKEMCGINILEAFPVYKQQNAALGLYDAETTKAIANGIQALRDGCNAKEAEINACETFEELDALC